MPILKLTKAAIDKLPRHNPGKSVIYWDTELKGFGLLVGTYTKRFIAQRKVKGATVRVTVGKYSDLFTVEKARMDAQQRLAEIVSVKRAAEAAEQARNEIPENAKEHFDRLLKKAIDAERVKLQAQFDEQVRERARWLSIDQMLRQK